MCLVGPVLALATAGALAASAAPAQVTGGGFYRDGKGRNATKTMLTVEGHPATHSGTATYTVSGPRKALAQTRIALSCVMVKGDTAYASGRDATGTEWFLKVVDNGEPGRGDHYGVSRNGDTIAPGVPVADPFSTTCRASSVGTRAITGGGNFQVGPAS